MKRKYRLSEKKYYREKSKKWKMRNAIAFWCVTLGILNSCFFCDEKINLKCGMLNCLFPILMYEKQYGKQGVDYTNDYAIPDWYITHKREEKNKEANEKNEKTVLADVKNPKEEEGEKKKSGEKDNKQVNKERKEEQEQLHKQSFTREQLQQADFLTSRIFAVDSNTHMTKEELSLEHLMDTDMTVKNLKEWDGKDQDKKCKVLIYHTHGSEAFRDSRPGKMEDTIIGVGAYLSEILEKKYNIPVYHDMTVYDMINGVNDRSGAYENAYKNVTQILKDNPSIEVVVDLHRDGVDEDIQLLTEINGKKTAKIMFLNGLSRSNTNGEIAYLKNPYRQENLDFSFQMYLKGKELYGDYIRKIYVKSLRFNMHLLPRTTLIEAGAQNNSIEEEKNAMEPLAEILDAVLSGGKEK